MTPETAIETAGGALGVKMPGKALHADNLKRFEAKVREALGQVAKAATSLPRELGKWAELLGVDAKADRLMTARSGDALVAALEGKGAVAQVEELAAFAPQTSLNALGKSMAMAPEVVRLLGERLVFGVFEQLLARRGELSEAGAILDQAAEALRQDELHVSLVERLRRLAEEGQKLITQSVPEPEPEPGVVRRNFPARASGKDAVFSELERLLKEARREAEELGDELTLSGTLTLTGKRKTDS